MERKTGFPTAKNIENYQGQEKQEKKEQGENERKEEWKRILETLNGFLKKEKEDQEKRTGDKLRVKDISKVENPERETLFFYQQTENVFLLVIFMEMLIL